MKYVELFCGGGGTSCGLCEAGWECVGAVDADATSIGIYSQNFPQHPVHQLDLDKALPVELVEKWRDALIDGAIVASSPCQAFSAARHASATNAANNAALTAGLAQHVRALAPRWVLWENVPRAAQSDEFRVLVDELRALGYATEFEIVDAQYAGVAQRRRRLVLLATRNPTALVSAWEQVRARLCVPTPSMRQCFDSAGVAYGGAGYIYIPACNPRGRKSVYSLDEVAPTVRCTVRPFRTRYVFTHRDACRDRAQIVANTCAHASALQGFPPWFSWDGCTQTARARCIGNAVPPPLARLVAHAVSASP